MTASGDVRSRMKAARPIAGAVLRPAGSARICFFSSRGNWRNDLLTQIVVSNHPKKFRRSQPNQARHGLLNHGLLAVQRQQLFGPPLTTEGPEARSASASENDWVKVGIFLRHS